MDGGEKREFPWPLLAGALGVLLIAGVVQLSTGGGGSKTEPQQRLPMGAEETAYAERIGFSNIRMSRASNLLNQEITFIHGVLENKGTHAIRDIEIRIEFRDSMNQVVLRDTLRPFGLPGPTNSPLPAGRSREFQLNFEHVPVDWNQQHPTFRVTGLVLE